MEEKNYPYVISEREQSEWIRSCPAQVREITLLRPAEGAQVQIYVTTVSCTEYNVLDLTVTLTIQNGRREVIGTMEDVAVKIGKTGPIPCPFEEAVYARAVIETVNVAGGETWENADGAIGEKLPLQQAFWNTDPLYETVKRECEGVVTPAFVPDVIPGGWRCACGGVNCEDSTSCGLCRCDREWLQHHLDRDYLTKKKRVTEENTKKQKPKKIKKNREKKPVSDRVKALLILAGAVAVLCLALLAPTRWIPSIRYAYAASLAEQGELDRSLAIFTDLGEYKDSSARAEDIRYQKAKEATGLETVVMTDSISSPWYEISAEGELAFFSDAFEEGRGDWSHIRIPDMVDGIVVTSLERNFFINCDQILEVTLSDCIVSIGEQCFLGCESLREVRFGKGLTTIGSRAFIDCYALESITVPDTVTSLGARAFNNCSSLNSVTLGKGITRLNDYTFSQCRSLRLLTLSAPLTEVGTGAFAQCDSLYGVACLFDSTAWIEPAVGEDNKAFTQASVHFADGVERDGKTEEAAILTPVGGGNNELLSPYMGMVDGVVYKKDTFSREYAAYMDDYLEMEEKWQFDRPALLYYLSQEMDLTREDLELYFAALGIDEVPGHVYDGLLAETKAESMQLLKSEFAFYHDGKLYTVYDVYAMEHSESLPFDLLSSEFTEIWQNISDYLATVTTWEDTRLEQYVKDKLANSQK